MKLLNAALAGVFLTLSAGATQAADVTGAGSTFAAPIYGKWADAYQKAGGAHINYQGIGSSGGLKQIIAKTVDFAGSDAPLTDEELASKGLAQFPTVVGGIVAVVNVPGLKAGDLLLDGQVLGDIYLGKISKWNDPAIARLNPGLKLPASDIAVVRRADGSGTTFVFTNYLAKVNPAWKQAVGEGSTVNWPVGMGGKGNDGVAAFVQRLPGSIGYVEYAYAKQNNLAFTKMVNRDGKTVSPDARSFQAAAAGADWSKTFYQILTDEPGADAWPILAATFVLMQAKQDKPQQGQETLKFFDWAYKNGTPQARELDYVTLPEAVIQRVRASWGQIKDSAGKPIAQ